MALLELNSRSYIFCLFLFGFVPQHTLVYLGVNRLYIFNYVLKFFINSKYNLIYKSL